MTDQECVRPHPLTLATPLLNWLSQELRVADLFRAFCSFSIFALSYTSSHPFLSVYRVLYKLLLSWLDKKILEAAPRNFSDSRTYYRTYHRTRVP